MVVHNRLSQETETMQIYRLALIGFGNVGQVLADFPFSNPHSLRDLPRIHFGFPQ